MSSGKIRVGIGGWTYEPWRGTFYPQGLSQKKELSYAAEHLSSIEVNGTFYGSQSPATFQKWHDETPDDFVFSLKAPRFATNRKVLAEAGESIGKFFESGVDKLGKKLGPINWQFAATKKFDAEDFEKFLALLPKGHRHAVEVRHESFKCEEFVALVRRHEVAVVVAGDSEHPQIADVTAPFVYARIMGTEEGHKEGYSDAKLDEWTARAKSYAEGHTPKDLHAVSTHHLAQVHRDVYLYVISGFKESNPAAAMAILKRL
jgi:uncharacterized protein YecE (DUF72 family)